MSSNLNYSVRPEGGGECEKEETTEIYSSPGTGLVSEEERVQIWKLMTESCAL